MKVAVVHNDAQDGVINRFGQCCPEKYSLRHVRMVVEALCAAGHTVTLLEADVSLFEELRQFMPTDPLTNQPTGIVFNMAYGLQGEARYSHLPAMLEMAGVPYTGSGPLAHALALDKVVTKVLAEDAGVPTAPYQVMSSQSENTHELSFPLVVKPRHESTSYGLQFVRDRRELIAAVDAIGQQYKQESLVEQYIDGREVCIGLLGNDPVEFLPPVELDFGDRELRMVTWDDKYHKNVDEPRKVCPAPIDAATLKQLNELALATYRACHLRDYARVDIRIDAVGRPYVLEINSMASLGDGGSYVRAATAAGYDFGALVVRILDVACQRHFGAPAVPDVPVPLQATAD